MITDPETVLADLCRGAAEIIELNEFKEKLFMAHRQGRPLTVKLGVDPTSPQMHLGHTVVLRKLRQLQQAGHQVVFLVGDFTGRIGDPSEKGETRRQLTEEEVVENARDYRAQVSRFLDPERTSWRLNSEWLSSMTLERVVELTAQSTVARMLEREDFKNRFASGRAVHLHEFLYPLLQGYDSVALKADVEMGGMDQKFNLLMARQLMRAFGQPPEIAFLMPLLVGLDGVQKMGKTAGNYISVDADPTEMYGKLMSLSDEVIGEYFRLLTDVPLSEVDRLQEEMKAGRMNPKDVKSRLARTICEEYHGAGPARRAAEEFDRIFSAGGLPDDIPVVSVGRGAVGIVELLERAQMIPSRAEARRLVAQGAVRLGDRKITDITEQVQVGDGVILKVGKRRFAKVVAQADD